jgi:hypothetical protein
VGRDNCCRGDADLQLSDPEVCRRLRLDRLRFGDLVAIRGVDGRFGRTLRSGYTSVGVIVHGDSLKSGHGPGVVTLVTGPARCIEPVHDAQANLARILDLRPELTAERQAALRHSGSRSAHLDRLALSFM